MAETIVERRNGAAETRQGSGSGQALIVQTKGLTKIYGTFKAVDSLDLQVNEGEVFGLLGPNGAGKTTTILMLLGLTEPTSGSLEVCGFNSTREPIKVKRLVGYLPENVGFYEDMTALENLRYTARLNGINGKDVDAMIVGLLGQVGLSEAADKRVGHFSRGMRQRLGIADVLVKSPKMVILDEPTLGLDPDGVNQLLDLIVRLSREQNITVMLCSHQLQQVQQICDRICIFVKGRMVVQGRIDELSTSALAGQQLTAEVQVAKRADEFADSLRRVEGVARVERDGDLMVVYSGYDVRERIGELAASLGTPLLHLRMRAFGLEEIYFKYFKEG